MAKLGISHAEPLSFLSVRYACVCALLAPLVIILRPPLPQMSDGDRQTMRAEIETTGLLAIETAAEVA